MLYTKPNVIILQKSENFIKCFDGKKLFICTLCFDVIIF